MQRTNRDREPSQLQNFDDTPDSQISRFSSTVLIANGRNGKKFCEAKLPQVAAASWTGNFSQVKYK